MLDTLFEALVASFAAGSTLFWLYFHRYETHLYGVAYLRGLVVLYILLATAVVKGVGTTLSTGLLLASEFVAAFLLGAYGNMLVFRLLLHPLNRFPGPFGARISNLWLSSQLGKSDGYLVLENLHRKYGKYVRIGSNDLSIIDPDASDLTYGKDSGVTKAAWYDNDHPLHSMHTTRDKSLHARRRRVWAPAFSDKALREYEPAIGKFSDQLVQHFREQIRTNEIVNITKWFNLFAFDAMGYLTFGKEYGMMQKGEKPAEISLLGEGMQPFALKLPSWLFQMMTHVPGLSAGYMKFVSFCIGELTHRVKAAQQEASNDKASPIPDVMSWLLRAYAEFPHPERDPMLQADAKLIIVAGSDTTAAALTFLFFHLAQHPGIVARLRDELEPLCGAGAGGTWSDKDIHDLPLLNACINETLRMHPPVPSGLYRLTPPEGLQIGDNYIPGNVTFIMPLYPMGRDPDSYVEPNHFVPERWTTRQEMVIHRGGFTPFSAGPMGCIGKAVALMELRAVAAKLLLNFDFSFGPDEDGRRLLECSRDHFTFELGDLELKVEELHRD